MGSVLDYQDLDKVGALEGVDVLAFKTPDAAYDGPTGLDVAPVEPAGTPAWESDAAPTQQTPEGKAKEKSSQATQLLQLAEHVEVFHTSDGAPFADVNVNGHRETLSIPGGFRHWLTRAFFMATASAPGNEALQSALATVAARAKYGGPERELFVRIAPGKHEVCLDLGDETWRAVEIGTAGWRIVDAPPVRFRRSPAARALPAPVDGGAVELLKPFVNYGSEDNWVLLVTWLVAALSGKGPFPLLVLVGEQGTAKSTLSRVLQSLVDPRTPAERPLPREDRDMAVAADNAYVLAFGNLSGLTAAQSDGLCRLATGGGFATRSMYADREEAVFDAMRPIIANGIDDFMTRADLGDRSILLYLEPIPGERRRPENELWRDFELDRPQILGALLHMVSAGLRNLPGLLPVERLPRMADFANLGRACETVLWEAGTFMAAYERNRSGVVESTLDGDIVAVCLRKLAERPGGWSGTATDLLSTLAYEVGDSGRYALPRTAKGLSDKLRRLATFLRAVGVQMVFSKEGKARIRTIRLWCEPTK